MFDIDCHIIIHKEPHWKIDRCMASFDGQAVNVHLVEGIDGDFPPFIGRAKGFAMGTAPYVCFADPDDWIEPDAFELLNAHLGEADVVHGFENIWDEGRIVQREGSLHHLYTVRRDIGIDLSGGFRAKFPKCTTHKLIDSVTYNWDITGGRYGRVG